MPARFEAAAVPTLAAPLPNGSLLSMMLRTQSATAPIRTLGLPTVWRCVTLIDSTITQLKLAGVRDRQPVDLPLWLRRPERYSQTRQRELVQHLVTSMALYGAGYLTATPTGDESWQLGLVSPGRVSVTLTADDRRVWRLDGEIITAAHGPSRTAGLLVVPWLLLPGRAEPMGPVQAALAGYAFDGWADTEAYANRIFRSGDQPGSRLETDQDIPGTRLKEWQSRWMEMHTNPEERTIPVLGAGLRLVHDYVEPRKAQWLESRTWNAQDTARMFGVPAHMLGLPAGDSLTYATARDNDAAYLRYTVTSYLRPIEDALSWLLPPGRTPAEDYRAEFDTEALLKPTTIDLWTALTTAVGGPWMTPAEARQRAGGLQPVPDDTFTPAPGQPAADQPEEDEDA